MNFPNTPVQPTAAKSFSFGKAMLWAGSWILVVSVVCGAIFYAEEAERKKFLSQATEVKATLLAREAVEVFSKSSNRNSRSSANRNSRRPAQVKTTHFFETYEFPWAEGKNQVRLKGDVNSAVPEGAVVSLWVNPADPYEAKTKDQLTMGGYHKTLFFMWIGAGFLLPFLAAFVIVPFMIFTKVANTSGLVAGKLKAR